MLAWRGSVLPEPALSSTMVAGEFYVYELS